MDAAQVDNTDTCASADSSPLRRAGSAMLRSNLLVRVYGTGGLTISSCSAPYAVENGSWREHHHPAFGEPFTQWPCLQQVTVAGDDRFGSCCQCSADDRSVVRISDWSLDFDRRQERRQQQEQVLDIPLSDAVSVPQPGPTQNVRDLLSQVPRSDREQPARTHRFEDSSGRAVGQDQTRDPNIGVNDDAQPRLS